ncbi:MAG: sigma-70 family RNA polymerase sigma factor [Myxococcota bacterium]
MAAAPGASEERDPSGGPRLVEASGAAEPEDELPKAKPSRVTSEERERDRELVRAVQAGDQAAFRELFERYHRRAYAVAFGVVRNKQDALDVVQEAFVKVHRHIQGFQGTSSFYTWLYRIVMNLSIDHVRRRKGTSLDYDDGIGRGDDEVAGDGALLPTVADANPRKTVLRRELAEAMQKALDTLPEHHRAVILLRELEGLSYEEMARVLEVPKGTIMSRLFHARRKMQAELEPYLQGDLDIRE